MKNLVFGIIATVLFVFNGNSQTIEDLKNSKNPFNEKGESFYNHLHETSNNIKNGTVKLDVYINDLKQGFNYQSNLTEEDLNVYKDFFSNKKIDLSNLIDFENYILNDSKLSKNEKLMQSVSILIWSNFYQTQLSRGIRGFENCLDRCMTKKLSDIFDHGNWIDQAAFVLTAAESTAIMVASCSFDCARDTTSH